MRPLRLCFLWHFHQPDYRVGNAFFLPWVYMHVVKDYVDLIRLFCEYPVKHTVNIVPSLLHQIDDYGRGMSDPILNIVTKDPETFTADDTAILIRWCRTAHYETMVAPLPRFNELHRRIDDPAGFLPSDILDLQVSLLLAWTGPLSRKDQRVMPLLTKAAYNAADKICVLGVHQELMANAVATFVEAERSGQIEISVTPFHHPILPLLVDTDVALESMPNASLPVPPMTAPDDAIWHIKMAREEWYQRSGRLPRGMWPSEGSVSTAVLDVMSSLGVRWTATDEDVLRHSLGDEYTTVSPFLQYDVGGDTSSITMLFRDHGLSDAIGFEYAGYEAEAAADDFLRRLEERRRMIVQELGDDALEYATIPVILDGENCWEFYQNNGMPFLRALLTRLSDRSKFDVVTCSEAASSSPSKHYRLDRLTAGSWIRGTFDIWIGTTVKNLAWSALREAREAVRAAGDPKDLLDIIRRCEASDWFWWYDDRHQAPNKHDFDHVFRTHLRTIFERTGTTCSIDLSGPFSEAVMERSTNIVRHPINFRMQGAMHEAEAITNMVSIETDGNWQRIIVHFQRPLLESEEVMITVTDRHQGERCCCVVHDDCMFRTALHDEGFERLPEGVAIYVHTTNVWFVTIEEQRASGNNPSITIPFELDLHGAG